jgi:hypothetical protein
MEFDENKVVDYINESLAAAGRPKYDSDEILNVVDMIWDFYEENGMLDVDLDDDETDDEDIEPELVDYVCRMLRKDKDAKVLPEDVPLIVTSEIEYEDSLLD